MMLQQTHVSRVSVMYQPFLNRFPNFEKLAHGPVADLLAAWRGLGYNRRVLALKKIAEIVCKKYDGKLPQSTEFLDALPGIGKGTAGAIAAFAFNLPTVFIETNIRRVFIYFFFSKKERVSDDQIMRYINAACDRKNPREWYYALMDYGAMLGRKKGNPNRRSTHYHIQSRFLGSDRELRGKILRVMITQKTVGSIALAHQLKEPLSRLEPLIKALHKEGFLIREGKKISIAQ